MKILCKSRVVLYRTRLSISPLRLPAPKTYTWGVRFITYRTNGKKKKKVGKNAKRQVLFVIRSRTKENFVKKKKKKRRETFYEIDKTATFVICIQTRFIPNTFLKYTYFFLINDLLHFCYRHLNMLPKQR